VIIILERVSIDNCFSSCYSFFMLKKQISSNQPGWFNRFFMIDQRIFAYAYGRLRDIHGNKDCIRRFLLNLSFLPQSETPIRKVTQEIEAASITDALNINSTNNPVGTPASTEKNCNWGAVAHTIPKTRAAPAVAIATKRVTPLIKPAHEAEVRRWLNASLLTRICQTACRIFLRLIYRVYFRFSVSGLEHVPARGPLIIVSNHSSHLDFGALIVALKKLKNTIHPMAARDYFFNTPFRCWASHVFLNVLPFDRQSYFGESITFALGVLRHGHSVIYFPEGSRTSGVIQSFKHGIGLLAVESGVPVLPAYISGTYQSLPKGKIFPLPYRVHVRFGAPVVVRQPESDESPSEFVRRVTVDMQRAVEVLSHQSPASSRG